VVAGDQARWAMTLAAIVAMLVAAGALVYVLAPLFGRHRHGDAPAAIARGAPAAITDEEIETAVRAYRAARPECPACGPCPEPDADYCSRCGRRLGGAEDERRT
jgi:hypothetical protein